MFGERKSWGKRETTGFISKAYKELVAMVVMAARAYTNSVRGKHVRAPAPSTARVPREDPEKIAGKPQ